MVNDGEKEDVQGIKQDPQDQFNNLVNKDHNDQTQTAEMIDDQDLNDESDNIKESESYDEKQEYFYKSRTNKLKEIERMMRRQQEAARNRNMR